MKYIIVLKNKKHNTIHNIDIESISAYHATKECRKEYSTIRFDIIGVYEEVDPCMFVIKKSDSYING